MTLDEPSVSSVIQTNIADVSVLEGLHEFRRQEIRATDFSESNLPGLRLHDCTVQDCLFDRCTLKDFRAWNSTFTDVSFRGANLRGAVLGPAKQSRRNHFQNVDFSSADLRGTIYQSAEFVDCLFDETILFKVEFNGSTFEDCVFVGDLREVMFFRKAFRVDDVPPNQMKNVDFSRARLSWCDFRELDLDTVIFPQDDDHIAIQNFPETLDRLLQIYGSRDEFEWRSLCAVVRHNKKWLGPRQRRGYFNIDDLREMVGSSNLPELLESMARIADLERPIVQ